MHAYSIKVYGHISAVWLQTVYAFVMIVGFWFLYITLSLRISTGYGLDDRGVGVRAPVESRIFSSPRRPDRLWGTSNLVSNGYRGLFPRGKADGALSSPLTSNKCRGQENVDLYCHRPFSLLHFTLLCRLDRTVNSFLRLCDTVITGQLETAFEASPSLI
jgi:hypothetical protein